MKKFKDLKKGDKFIVLFDLTRIEPRDVFSKNNAKCGVCIKSGLVVPIRGEMEVIQVIV